MLLVERESGEAEAGTDTVALAALIKIPRYASYRKSLEITKDGSFRAFQLLSDGFRIMLPWSQNYLQHTKQSSQAITLPSPTFGVGTFFGHRPMDSLPRARRNANPASACHSYPEGRTFTASFHCPRERY